MHCEAVFEVVRGLTLYSLCQVLLKHWLVDRIHTVLNNKLRSLTWRLATEVCNTVLSDENLDRVLALVKVRNHRHYRADLAILGCCRCGEY